MNNSKMQSVNRLEPLAQRRVPVVQLSFHGQYVCYKLVGQQRPDTGKYDPTDVILSVNTNKSMDAPAGTFTITLAGDSWFTITPSNEGLQPNDLVVISLGYKSKNKTVTLPDGTTKKSDYDIDTVMIGLIDTITRTRNSGGANGMPNIQTVITGRDFGKILIKSTLKFYPQLGAADTSGQKFFLTETGWITLLKAFTNDNAIKGSPAKVLDTILRYILMQIVKIEWKIYDYNNFVPGSMPGYRSAELGHIMQYVLAQTNFFIPFFMSAQQYEGSIWNLMSKVNIKPFTEMFVDTRDKWEIQNSSGVPQLVSETVEERSSEDKGEVTDGKWARPGAMLGENDDAQVVFVYRNTPFDDNAWNKLRTHTIPAMDLIQDTLSYSDNENYNLFWAGSTLTPFSSLDLKAVNPPIINEDNIKRYGLSPLEINVEGLELDKTQESEQTIALEGLSSTLNTKLQSWFQDNVYYLSGSLLVVGNGKYKIGQKVVCEASSIEAYIESVTQNWQLYSQWQTQLGVTRGRLTAPTVAYDASKDLGWSIGDAIDTALNVTSDTAASTQSDSAVSARYYTVQDPDTLWSIAAAQLGDGNRWSEIWDLNKDMLIARDSRNASDPGHWIYTGQKLLMP